MLAREFECFCGCSVQLVECVGEYQGRQRVQDDVKQRLLVATTPGYLDRFDCELEPPASFSRVNLVGERAKQTSPVDAVSVTDHLDRVQEEVDPLRVGREDRLDAGCSEDGRSDEKVTIAECSGEATGFTTCVPVGGITALQLRAGKPDEEPTSHLTGGFVPLVKQLQRPRVPPSGILRREGG